MGEAKPSSKAARVCVIGSGSWGTAVTSLLSARADSIGLWCHEAKVADAINATRHNPIQLPDFELPANVQATASMEEATAGADAVLLVVPSAFLRETCAKLAPYVGQDVPVLVLTKGVERGTGCLMATVASQELGNDERIAVLSGPNHAEEISRGTISAAVVAASDERIARYFQQLLVCPAFRVYVTNDVAGVEICAAEKNVIAIACGIAAAFAFCLSLADGVVSTPAGDGAATECGLFPDFASIPSPVDEETGVGAGISFPVYIPRKSLAKAVAEKDMVTTRTATSAVILSLFVITSATPVASLSSCICKNPLEDGL